MIKEIEETNESLINLQGIRVDFISIVGKVKN